MDLIEQASNDGAPQPVGLDSDDDDDSDDVLDDLDDLRHVFCSNTSAASAIGRHLAHRPSSSSSVACGHRDHILEPQPHVAHALKTSPASTSAPRNGIQRAQRRGVQLFPLQQLRLRLPLRLQLLRNRRIAQSEQLSAYHERIRNQDGHRQHQGGRLRQLPVATKVVGADGAAARDPQVPGE